MYTRRQAMKLLAAAAAGPTLGACAFQPVYGPTATGEAMQDVLAGVEVAPVPGRVGQRIRNELIFGLTGGGYRADAKYRLQLAVRESITRLQIEQTGEARGETYNLNVAFTLVRLEDGAVALRGRSLGRAALDRYRDLAFANVRARIDAEDRAARHAAENIKTRVAAFLATAA